MGGGGQHLRARALGTEGGQKGRADVQPWKRKGCLWSRISGDIIRWRLTGVMESYGGCWGLFQCMSGAIADSDMHSDGSC